MPKRKPTGTELVKEPESGFKITVSPPEPIQAATATDVKLRCIYESTLIISGDRTVTGKGYSFTPGQVQPVDPLDYDFLLSLEQKAGGCCGGGPAEAQKYFEEVS